MNKQQCSSNDQQSMEHFLQEAFQTPYIFETQRLDKNTQ